MTTTNDRIANVYNDCLLLFLISGSLLISRNFNQGKKEGLLGREALLL
jgi:hypothetical protein